MAGSCEIVDDLCVSYQVISWPVEHLLAYEGLWDMVFNLLKKLIMWSVGSTYKIAWIKMVWTYWTNE
jgi:hypothetical protein